MKKMEKKGGGERRRTKKKSKRTIHIRAQRCGPSKRMIFRRRKIGSGCRGRGEGGGGGGGDRSAEGQKVQRSPQQSAAEESNRADEPQKSCWRSDFGRALHRGEVDNPACRQKRRSHDPQAEVRGVGSESGSRASSQQHASPQSHQP